MISVRVAWNDLGKMEKTLAKTQKVAVVQAMRESAALAVGMLKAATLVAPAASPGGRPGIGANSTFYQGWKAENVPTGAVVLNRVPHAEFVEFGRRPGRPPPVSAIEVWLAKNGMMGNAYPIARAIGLRGLRPRNILSSTLPAINALTSAKTGQAIDLALRKSLR